MTERMPAKFKLRYRTGVGVASRFQAQYSGKLDEPMYGRPGISVRQAINDLLALGETPDPDEVDRAIGNKSWTAITCDGCGEDFQKLIVLAEPDEREVMFCEQCLLDALVEFRSAP